MLEVVPFDLFQPYYFASSEQLSRSFKNFADTVICSRRAASQNVCGLNIQRTLNCQVLHFIKFSTPLLIWVSSLTKAVLLLFPDVIIKP